MPRIDVHAHLVPESCADLIPGRNTDAGKPPNVLDSMSDIPERMGHMDERGIDVQLISMPPWLCNLEINTARRLNDGVAEAITPHKDRFAGLATVPMADPEVAARELERCVKELGFVGLEILSNVEGENLDKARFAPLYRKMVELGTPAFIHPHNVLAAKERLQDFYLTNLIGNPTDTAVAAASLIFGGVLQEMPDLKFILAHGGGTCPYLRGRWEHGWRRRVEGPRIIHRPPSEYFQKLYFDTLTHSVPALNYLVETVGAEHVMLGSDYPFDMGDYDPVKSVSALPHASDAEKEAIYGGNAAEVFKLDVAAAAW